MGRPPQEAAAKPVRTRRKRGGRRVTLQEASNLLANWRSQEKDLRSAIADLLPESAACAVLEQEADRLRDRISAIEALTVGVPA